MAKPKYKDDYIRLRRNIIRRTKSLLRKGYYVPEGDVSEFFPPSYTQLGRTPTRRDIEHLSRISTRVIPEKFKFTDVDPFTGKEQEVSYHVGKSRNISRGSLGLAPQWAIDEAEKIKRNNRTPLTEKPNKMYHPFTEGETVEPKYGAEEFGVGKYSKKKKKKKDEEPTHVNQEWVDRVNNFKSEEDTANDTDGTSDYNDDYSEYDVDEDGFPYVADGETLFDMLLFRVENLMNFHSKAHSKRKRGELEEYVHDNARKIYSALIEQSDNNHIALCKRLQDNALRVNKCIDTIDAMYKGDELTEELIAELLSYIQPITSIDDAKSFDSGFDSFDGFTAGEDM